MLVLPGGGHRGDCAPVELLWTLGGEVGKYARRMSLLKTTENEQKYCLNMYKYVLCDGLPITSCF